ncbi:MAG: hypothetical protein GXP63_04145 [DPANN group archaeon]|nr:hypothetical protein [DPANN group archaeon]
MPLRFKHLLKGMLPLSPQNKDALASLEDFLDANELSLARTLLRQGRAGIFSSPLHLSSRLYPKASFPSIRPATEDPELGQLCAGLNNSIKERIRRKAMRKITKDPWVLLESFANHIIGMEPVKKAALLQLFSDEPIHLLLLGDPGTGKTDILRATEELAPIASFGLGSGTSGVGLTVMFKGKEMIKGLLPLADQGICCIDELNLMKEQDYAALYNAMEKGFITYSKGSKNVRLDARVRILATANPKGDRFVGNDVALLKKQMPFDPALLSRFHLVFLIRGPSLKEFKKISEHIVSGKTHKISATEKEVIREYIEKTLALDIVFPSSLKEDVVLIGQQLKKQENDLLIEVSPRLIHGIVRLARAHARMHSRSKVKREDVQAVEAILRASMSIKRSTRTPKKK